MATRAYRGIGPVPTEALARLTDGTTQQRQGALEELTRWFEQVRSAQASTAAAASSSSGASGGSTAPTPAPAPTPGPPGPPGPPGTPYVPDLTPPPTPSGVVVTAGLEFVFITTDAPTFTEGNGYLRTRVYAAQYGGSGPLPTFGDAVLRHEFSGQVGSFEAPPNTQWHVWLKWQTRDGVESVSPQGGANGNQVTTSSIGNVHLGPLIVEAGNLAAGAVTTAKFAAGIEPVSIVAALPSPIGYTGPRTVMLTTDGKLYRYVAGAWTSAVPAVDITGQITTTQITPGAITTPLLAAGSVTAANIAANTITANEIAANAITASELAANSVVAGKIAAAAVSATEIAASAIQAVHLAANSIAVGTAAIQNGAIVNAMIANATITDAKIVTLSASKITAGSLAVGEHIQSSGFTPGGVGFRIDGGGGAEFRFSGGTRVFHLGASGTDPILRAPGLDILANGSATFSGALSGATGTFAGSLSAATGSFSGAITGSSFTGGTVTGSVIQTATIGQRVILNESSSNEARFYGNRGDGVVELLASIGITQDGLDFYIGKFGSANSTRNALFGLASTGIGVIGASTSNIGVFGSSTSYFGVEGSSASSSGVRGSTTGSTNAAGVRGDASHASARGVTGDNLAANGVGVYGSNSSPSGGTGVEGFTSAGQGVKGSSTTGYGGHFTGNSTRAPLFLEPHPAGTAPSDRTLGGIALLRTLITFPGTYAYRPCYADGTDWRRFDTNAVVTL